MTIKFSSKSSFLPLLADWIEKNRTAICGHREVSICIEPRTGFVKQQAMVTISPEDRVSFETDWPYGKSLFPSRVKALASALSLQNIHGAFET